jgi:hypothetical protein
MNLTPTDRRKLDTLLSDLLAAIETFLRTGLATASDTTRQTFNVTFQEASRLRLLRLGSTLRFANDEMAKLVKNDADFSRSRFAFFLNRTWLLARGLRKALAEKDDASFDKLFWTPPSQPVAKIEAAVLGVGKKVVPGTFAAFDFRMRLVSAAGDLPAGLRISWSCVFPLKPGQEVPAEAFLHLPQKQKFTASQLLEGKTVVFEKAALARDEFGGARLALGEQSALRLGDTVEDYEPFLAWDVVRALERVDKHEPTPFELDVELQEEAVLRDWVIGAPEPREAEKQVWYPLMEAGVLLTAVASAQTDGDAHRKYLNRLGEDEVCPLFGLLHYEKCRLVFQPLTLFGPKGLVHLMLSPDKVDRATLLRAMKF